MTKLEFEFTDGSSLVVEVTDGAPQAWAEVADIESRGVEILSAWRDNEPWFGLCTDMREGTP